MLIPHGTVIALIDGKHLELYRNSGDEAEPEFAALPSPKLDAHNHSGASHHSSAGNHDDHMVIEDAHAGAAAATGGSRPAALPGRPPVPEAMPSFSADTPWQTPRNTAYQPSKRGPGVVTVIVAAPIAVPSGIR